jgi:hypothetical protein
MEPWHHGNGEPTVQLAANAGPVPKPRTMATALAIRKDVIVSPLLFQPSWRGFPGDRMV